MICEIASFFSRKKKFFARKIHLGNQLI